MENSTSSLESSQSHELDLRNAGQKFLQRISRRSLRSNRPDLQDEDFQGLNLQKVNEFKETLRPNAIFGGHEDELKIFETVDLTSFDTVELVGEEFARGPRSYIYTARVDGQWFACKKSWISGKYDRNLYDKEQECLKALRSPGNWHIVQLMAYHTVQACNEGCLVLSPLAECTLGDYLSRRPTPGCKQAVMRWFGCLAGALSDIHRRNIKHKDIKPSNILVHGDNVVIADLGISTKFADQSSSIGLSPGSLEYMAPEVKNCERRGRRQDVWSLLCCFIEMISFISGSTSTEFREKCAPCHRFSGFDEDYQSVLDWLHLEYKTKPPQHSALFELLFNGFKKIPEERPTAETLFSLLRDSGTFVGECCASLHGSHAENISVSSSSGIPASVNTGPLRDFIVSTRDCITNQLSNRLVDACMDELLQRVNIGQVRSLRSCEKNLLFYIAPVCPLTTSKWLDNLTDMPPLEEM